MQTPFAERSLGLHVAREPTDSWMEQEIVSWRDLLSHFRVPNAVPVLTFPRSEELSIL